MTTEETCGSEEVQQLEKTEPIERAWLLVRVIDSGVNLSNLGCRIVDSINSDTIYVDDVPYLCFDDDIRNFVVRADEIAWAGDPEETYHLVVAVSAKDDNTIGAMIEEISVENLAGANAVVHVAKVTAHFPVNPWHSQGYIAEQEENSPAGRVHPTGHNPWG